MKSFKGKVAVVTGGAAGIGKSLVLELARRGAHVAFNDIADMSSTVSAISDAGVRFYNEKTDMSDKAQIKAFSENVLREFGHIDVLINNAGIMPLAAMSKLKVDEWDQTIDINIKGVLYGIAAVLPNMQAQQTGHIINLSSVAGLKVAGGLGTVYSATKFAVKAISEGLRMEVAADNIRVTTLYPGAIASELVHGSSDAQAGAAMQAFYEQYEISADSVARAIAYAIEQPDDVAINEITLRPTRQDF